MRHAKNAEEFAKWLEEHLPHISMKDKTEYRNRTTAITFICAEHGEYITQPHTVKKVKLGCRLCGGSPKKLSFDNFVNSAAEVHGDKYNYDENTWHGASKKNKDIL